MKTTIMNSLCICFLLSSCGGENNQNSNLQQNNYSENQDENNINPNTPIDEAISNLIHPKDTEIAITDENSIDKYKIESNLQGLIIDSIFYYIKDGKLYYFNMLSKKQKNYNLNFKIKKISSSSDKLYLLSEDNTLYILLKNELNELYKGVQDFWVNDNFVLLNDGTVFLKLSNESIEIIADSEKGTIVRGIDNAFILLANNNLSLINNESIQNHSINFNSFQALNIYSINNGMLAVSIADKVYLFKPDLSYYREFCNILKIDATENNFVS